MAFDKFNFRRAARKRNRKKLMRYRLGTKIKV